MAVPEVTRIPLAWRPASRSGAVEGPSSSGPTHALGLAVARGLAERQHNLFRNSLDVTDSARTPAVADLPHPWAVSNPDAPRKDGVCPYCGPGNLHRLRHCSSYLAYKAAGGQPLPDYSVFPVGTSLNMALESSKQSRPALHQQTSA